MRVRACLIRMAGAEDGPSAQPSSAEDRDAVRKNRMVVGGGVFDQEQ